MSILDLIDNVVDEHDLVSADAMRWAPDAPDPTSPALTATRLAAICDIPPELIDGDPLTLGTARLSRMHSPVPPQEEEPMTADEKRVIVIKPGDVLLIGNMQFDNPEQLAAGREMFAKLGLSPVVFFSSDIEVDKLDHLQLCDLLARVERPLRRLPPGTEGPLTLGNR